MAILTLAELQAGLGGVIRGDGGVALHGAASLEKAGPGQLGFLLSRKYLNQARASQAGALIIPEALDAELPQPCLAVTHPHATFARALSLLYPETAAPAGIHPTAVVAPNSRIASSAQIGPGCVVAAGVEIGERSVLAANCHIGANARIGADCHLHAGVVIQHGCSMGDRCLLHPGAVIGADGFGLAWENDHWIKVPQVGRVILGDDVEVGANTCIDRGALDDTLIGDGVKLDNLIQIGHNVRIGAHTAIAACAAIAGSASIGAYCQIGGCAMIAGHLDICDKVTVSGGTLIAKDIREPGVYTSVQPFQSHEDWRRNIAHLRHLDSLAKKIKELEKKDE